MKARYAAPLSNLLYFPSYLCNQNTCLTNRGTNKKMKLIVDHVQKQPVAKRHHMVSGTLALLYTVFGLKLG